MRRLQSVAKVLLHEPQYIDLMRCLSLREFWQCDSTRAQRLALAASSCHDALPSGPATQVDRGTMPPCPETSVEGALEDAQDVGKHGRAGDVGSSGGSVADPGAYAGTGQRCRSGSRFEVAVADSVTEMRWSIPIRKFEARNQIIVSPEISVMFADGTEHIFVILLKAAVVSLKKRGADFGSSQGRGDVVLKCETIDDDSPSTEASINLTVGRGEGAQKGCVRMHDFSERPNCSLKPSGEDCRDWDFRAGQDDTDGTNDVVVTARICLAAPEDTCTKSE